MPTDYAMSEWSLTTRRMKWDDIPEILRLAEDRTARRWLQSDFLEVFQRNETIGFVSMARRRIAGFALCTITRITPARPYSTRPIAQRLLNWFPPSRSGPRWYVNLFGMALDRDWPLPVIEQGLFNTLENELRRPKDRIQCVVPEASVAAQVVLRNAGFRALRLIPDYLDGETGYVMTRENMNLHRVSCTTQQVQAHRPTDASTMVRRGSEVGKSVRPVSY
ncbi:MAG TPA: hypothetical protein VMJ32_11560 [Pirellulales bacterium]|nr:hypothetical protein [Pirellulales bacterium]